MNIHAVPRCKTTCVAEKLPIRKQQRRTPMVPLPSYRKDHSLNKPVGEEAACVGRVTTGARIKLVGGKKPQVCMVHAPFLLCK
jgi:hypothetical protein